MAPTQPKSVQNKDQLTKNDLYSCVFGANGQGRNVLMLVGVGDAGS